METAEPVTYRITLEGCADAAIVARGEAITWALQAQGIKAPFGCHWGNCGVCRARLVSGRVSMQPHSVRALSAADRRAGWILACRAVPESDCAIAWDPRIASTDHPLQRASGRVVEVAAATGDIRVVQVKLDDDASFAFTAGQYAVVGFGPAPSRDYSMANRPGEPIITFHVRHMPGGATSAYVASALDAGMPVTLEGPYGTCWLRPGHRGPILAIAGGSGLAPVRSILREALAADPKRRIALYIGARAEDELYGLDELAALAGDCPGLRVTPVIAKPRQARFRHGTIAAAVRSDLGGLADLGDWKAYMAGPPPMVAEAGAALRAIGFAAADCHADPFYSEAEMRAL